MKLICGILNNRIITCTIKITEFSITLSTFISFTKKGTISLLHENTTEFLQLRVKCVHPSYKVGIQSARYIDIRTCTRVSLTPFMSFSSPHFTRSPLPRPAHPTPGYIMHPIISMMRYWDESKQNIFKWGLTPPRHTFIQELHMEMKLLRWIRFQPPRTPCSFLTAASCSEPRLWESARCAAKCLFCQECVAVQTAVQCE